MFYCTRSLQIYSSFQYMYCLTFPVTQSPVCTLVLTAVPNSLSTASLVFRIATCLWLYHSLLTKFLGVADMRAHLQPIESIILFIRSIKVVTTFSVLCFKLFRSLMLLPPCVANDCRCPLFLVLICVLWCSSSLQQVLG